MVYALRGPTKGIVASCFAVLLISWSFGGSFATSHLSLEFFVMWPLIRRVPTCSQQKLTSLSLYKVLTFSSQLTLRSLFFPEHNFETNYFVVPIDFNWFQLGEMHCKEISYDR